MTCCPFGQMHFLVSHHISTLLIRLFLLLTNGLAEQRRFLAAASVLLDSLFTRFGSRLSQNLLPVSAAVGLFPFDQLEHTVWLDLKEVPLDLSFLLKTEMEPPLTQG
jgi:uncharacterized membrane protein YwaF